MDWTYVVSLSSKGWVFGPFPSFPLRLCPHYDLTTSSTSLKNSSESTELSYWILRQIVQRGNSFTTIHNGHELSYSRMRK